MKDSDTSAFIAAIQKQLANAPDGVDTSALTAALEALANPEEERVKIWFLLARCLLYTSPSPRALSTSRMPSSA